MTGTPSPIPPFPLEAAVAQAKRFASTAPPPTGSFKKAEYLDVINGTVQHFRQFQNKTVGTPNYGKIVDPYTHAEMQYSTPCFANAGATLIAAGYYGSGEAMKALLADVVLAVNASLTALVYGQPNKEGTQGCAQGHCNFYAMPLYLCVHTLSAHASQLGIAQSYVDEWHAAIRLVDPLKAYRGPRGVTPGNWGIVAITAELLRARMGLGNNQTWVEMALQMQEADHRWTDNGEYMDRSGCGGQCSPMPYDHFPRKYEAVMLWPPSVLNITGYDGANATLYAARIERAAWVSLLLQSPWGELPTGGRSSQHQWNEAVSCVTYEIFASRMKAAGDAAAAGMFKRAAALSVMSLRRWKDPETGAWWVLKNRFDPALRHGYEGYTFYSQYNLLPASMLATAYLYADDSIPMGAAPAEVGGYVFSPDQFGKVIANAGGMYAEVELHADQPTHDVMGLTRVHHRSADPFVTVTAGAPNHVEGAADANPGGSLGLGATWVSATGAMGNLSSQTYATVTNTNATFSLADASPAGASFSVTYSFAAPVAGVSAVTETYAVTPSNVSLQTELVVVSPLKSMGFSYPVLSFDGQRHTVLSLGSGRTCSLELGGDATSGLGTTCAQVNLTWPPTGSPMWAVSADNVTSRNGFMRRVSASVPVHTERPTVTAVLTPFGRPCAAP